MFYHLMVILHSHGDGLLWLISTAKWFKSSHTCQSSWKKLTYRLSSWSIYQSNCSRLKYRPKQHSHTVISAFIVLCYKSHIG